MARASRTPGRAGARRRRRRLPRNVRALAAVSLLNDAASEMIYPLLPVFLTRTLGVGAAGVGVIEGVAEAVASLLKLASGWLSDRTRRRKPLVAGGYALAAAARPLVAVATAMGHVLAVRVADRVGKGLRSSPRDALLADSTPASIRGGAYGFHRAADHAGAVAGPLLAWAVLRRMEGSGGAAADVDLRTVFWLAAIPGVLAVLVVLFVVRERPRRGAPASRGAPGLRLSPDRPLGRPFWTYVGVVLLFTLGNSSDAFLLLRASELGVDPLSVLLLWAAFHVVKSASSTPAGALSDRVGRRPLIVAGWAWFALVYAGFAFASATWHAWALFLAYGLFFGLTEGTEKALVADLVPEDRRGTAFGWFHLAVGVGALPASVVFGVLWEARGAAAAFLYGASLAVVAAGLLVVLARPRRGATA